jgi:transcriptional regulator with GAF, ATPase, and Fis domain
MEEAARWMRRVAPSTSTVLLSGESGTGKELMAEALHALSDRRRGPFVRVNVAALPESLLESELFGHERGAFTGAVAQRRGKFEQAHGGTLFLDEIGDVSPATQVRLLRVLQTRRFERVGGSRSVEVDVRVVCATNRPLDALVATGQFRLDLYHRIRGVTIALPPLRDRGRDAVLLAELFAARLSEEHGREVALTEEALEAIAAHDWPGNVRELDNAIRAAFLLTDGPHITAPMLERHSGVGGLVTRRLPTHLDADAHLPPLDDAMRDLEVQLIASALERAGGNIAEAARLLRVKRPRLSQKIREYGIAVPGRE